MTESNGSKNKGAIDGHEITDNLNLNYRYWLIVYSRMPNPKYSSTDKYVVRCYRVIGRISMKMPIDPQVIHWWTLDKILSWSARRAG